MKPDKIIIRSQDAEIYDKKILDTSTAINTILGTVGITTTQNYYTGNTSRLTHDFIKFLEKPKFINLRKVILPAGIPTFNESNKTLRCLRLNVNDNSQNYLFNIEMDTNNVYTTYTELNNALTAKFQAINVALSTSINTETGILTINSTDNNFHVFVIERNEKFGFLYPWFPFLDGSSPYSTVGQAPVQLAQTRHIYIRSNIETNNYLSDGDTKILGVIPYNLDLKDIASGSYKYINNSDEFIEIQETDHSKITLEFLDENKNLMNFNYQPVSVEIDLRY